MLAKIRAGDRKAFEELVRGTWDELVEHLSWVLKSREGAEDAAQEAFIRLWEHRERWREGSARALVFRIGRNLALDERRKEGVRQDWTAREAGDVGRVETPAEHAELADYEGRFRAALEALTPGRREVIELVRLRGLTHREAAEALDLSPQTVANRMTLALADLRVLLADVLPRLAGQSFHPRARETNDG